MRPRSPAAVPMPRKLRRRIVRQMRQALKNVQLALDGKGFCNDDQRHASLALVRMAPRLFRPGDAGEQEVSPIHPRWTPAEAKDLMERLSAAGRTREECAQEWAEKLLRWGPRKGQYRTLEEAQEYGRKVWDRIQAQPEFVPHAELKQRSAQGRQS